MAFTKANSTKRPPRPIEVGFAPSIHNAVVFGHRDADGHLAAEQTRDYLIQRELEVTQVVSSVTQNYWFWKRLRGIDLTSYDVVVVVDIAFRFGNPEESLNYLLEVADNHPDIQFIAIDHHPLAQPKTHRDNLELYAVSDPYDCCLGIPDPDLMALAALCDGAPTRIPSTPALEKRARGMRRAAADIYGIAGEQLLKLIRQRNWAILEALADEDMEMHKTARGVRRAVSQPSPQLQLAKSIAL
ncbi:MAG: hypothetical protein OXC99_10685 [Chloroflexi bacterium]|nr:hypothetical protein [Chloroflexota bacterium]